jgi:hypothetical protein
LTPDETVPAADVGAGLLSLPLILGSTLESIPKNVPYISAEPALVEEWRGRIGGDREMKRVGIVWSGETADGTPVSGGPAVHRVNLGPILNTPGIRFVGLHPESDASEGDELLNVSADVRDLGDMAAILESLDLLIAVDSAALHLAGAMGRPAWGLLPMVSHWCWMRARENSPWYPTVRLFRQPVSGDWGTPVGRIAEELRRFAGVR